MSDGWDQRHQLQLRVLGTAVWWIVSTGLDSASRATFTPMHVIRTLPGFHYEDGEERVSEDKPQGV